MRMSAVDIAASWFTVSNRKCQDYVYVKWEYRSTMWKIKHYLRHEDVYEILACIFLRVPFALLGHLCDIAEGGVVMVGESCCSSLDLLHAWGILLKVWVPKLGRCIPGLSGRVRHMTAPSALWGSGSHFDEESQGSFISAGNGPWSPQSNLLFSMTPRHFAESTSCRMWSPVVYKHCRDLLSWWMRRTWHLVALQHMTQWCAQSSKLLRPSWRVSWSSSEWMGRYSRQSYASSWHWEWTAWGKLLMRARKSKGPSSMPR